MDKRKKILVFGFGLFFTILTVVMSIHKAQNKLFWLDEGHEILSIVNTPLKNILLGMEGQCNAAPLYFAFQKIAVGYFNQAPDFNHWILTQYRLVSILSAGLLVGILYVSVSLSSTWYWGLLAVLPLLNYGIFYQYAAENRPYSLWLFCFAGFMLSTIHLLQRQYEQQRLRDKCAFLAWSVALSLVISTGVVQVGLALTACVFVWWFLSGGGVRGRPIFEFAGPVMVICVLIELYYAKASAVSHYGGSQFDLWLELKKGNYELIKMPLRLLLPKPGRDTSIFAYLENILVIIGCCVPWLERNKKTQLGLSFPAAVAVAGLFQLAATLIIGSLVVYYHYYFVQRIFLNLIICHVVLGLAGAMWLIRCLNGRFRRIALCFFFACLVLTSALRWAELAQGATDPALKSSVGELVKEPQYDGYRIEGELKDLLNTVSTVQGDLNKAVRVDIALAQNPQARGTREPRILWHNAHQEWFLTKQVPLEGIVFQLFGQNKYFQ